MARTSRTGRIVAEDRAGATGVTGLTIDAAIDSYRLSLRAGNKSPATIRTYLAALASFSRFLALRGMPRVLRAIRREHVESTTDAIAASATGGRLRMLVDVGLQPDRVDWPGPKRQRGSEG